MFYLCFITVVDSRDIENLKYKKFKFKTSLIIESQKELIEIRNKINSFFNINNVEIIDYIKWSLKNLPYSKNQCKPRVYKVNNINDIFTNEYIEGDYEE